MVTRERGVRRTNPANLSGAGKEVFFGFIKKREEKNAGGLSTMPRDGVPEKGAVRGGRETAV